MDLKDIRIKIDEIDEEILNLFLNRMQLSKLAVREKSKNKKNLRDRFRENQIIDCMIKKSQSNSNYSKILFETILLLSRHKQYEILKEEMLKSGLNKSSYLNYQFKEELEEFKLILDSLEV